MLLSEELWRAIENADKVLADGPTKPALNLPAVADVQDDISLDVFLARIVSEATTQGLDDLDSAVVFVFVGHCILLNGFVSLAHRGSSAVPSSAEDFQRVHGEDSTKKIFALFTRLFDCINTAILQRPGKIGNLDLDLHVFLRMLAFISCGDAIDLSSLAAAVGPAYERLQAVYAASGTALPDISALATLRPRSQLVSRAAPASTSTVGVLPFDNPVFNNSPLGRLAIETESILEPPTLSSPRFSPGLVYVDKKHWQNQNGILPKHQGGEGKPDQAEWLRKKALKKEQRFMASFQKFAESLAGTGAGLQQQVITSGGHGSTVESAKTSQPSSSAGQSSIKANSKSTKSTKAKPLTKKEIMLKQIQTDKASVRHSDSQKWWIARLEDIAALPSSEERLVATKNLASNKRLTGADAEPSIALEYQLYMIHLQLQAWIAQGSDGQGGQPVHDSFTVQLLLLVSKAYKSPGHTTATVAALNSVLTAIGLKAYIPGLSSTAITSEDADRRLSFKFEKLLKSSGSAVHKWMHIVNEDPILWQLRVFGEYMDRSLDSRPDKRVPFEPDAWQRKVLNALDADESVLVVGEWSAVTSPR